MSCAYSPKGNIFAASTEESIIVWDARYKNVLHTLKEHTAAVLSPPPPFISRNPFGQSL